MCCDSCSTKRLKLSLGGGNSPPPAGKSGKGDGGADRVCDSCFNRLVFEANRWEIDQNRRRKEQLRLEQSMLESAANKNGKLMAGSKSTSNTGGNKIDVSNGVMNETMRALEERGQKIAEVAEKSEALTVVGVVSAFILDFYNHKLVGCWRISTNDQTASTTTTAKCGALSIARKWYFTNLKQSEYKSAEGTREEEKEIEGVENPFLFLVCLFSPFFMVLL